MPSPAIRRIVCRSSLLLAGSFGLAHVAGASAAPQDVPFALAYIDPGTGSFLVQAIVAAVAGIAVTTRMYWQRIKRFLGMAADDDDDAGPPRADE